MSALHNVIVLLVYYAYLDFLVSCCLNCIPYSCMPLNGSAINVDLFTQKIGLFTKDLDKIMSQILEFFNSEIGICGVLILASN